MTIENIFSDNGVYVESIDGGTVYVEVLYSTGGSGSASWGDVTGTLSNQTDLQTALDAKADSSSLASYQQTANMSLYQATSLMTNYLNTGYSTHTHEYIPTANSTNFLDTSYSSHTHPYLNTSVSSQFQTVGNYLTTAMQSGASTQFVQAGAAFNGTNISGTIASNGISLSAAPAGAADGVNRIAAGSQTAGSVQTVVFSNSNNVSFGMSNSSIVTASMSQSVQPVAFSASGSSSAFSTLQFGNSNGVSFSISNGSLVGSVQTNYQSSNANYLTSQSNQAFSASGGSSAFQTLNFANSNGFTFSNSNGSVVGSYTVPSTAGFLTTARASNDAVGLNTALTGNGVAWTVNSSGLSLNVPAFLTTAMASNAGSSFVAASAAFAGTNASGTIASNGISVSVAAPGAAAENNWVNLLGANTSGNTTASGSTIAYSGINVTLSGTNGSVINISGPAPTVLSRVIFPPYGQISSSGITNSQMSFRYFSVDDAVSFTRVEIPINVSIGSSGANNTANIVFTSGAAIYSRNGSTLNPIVGSTGSTTLTWASNNTSYNEILGGRYATWGLASSLTPGEYWLGAFISTNNNSSIGTATTAIANTISVFVGSFLTAQNFADWGVSTNVSSLGIVPLQGCVSLSISNTTMTFQQSQITQSGTAGMRGNIWFNLRNV